MDLFYNAGLSFGRVELDDQGLEPVDDSSLSDAPKSGGLDRVSLLYNDIPHNSSVKWLFLPH